ncbi:hypothetical protein Efla_007022 [Eimeria flavescens]
MPIKVASALSWLKQTSREENALSLLRAGSCVPIKKRSLDNDRIRSRRGGVGTRAYVEGSPTLVKTDHSPLPWIRSNVGKSAKIAGWVLALQDFSFDLKHMTGKCHNVPDALSRNATLEPGAEEAFDVLSSSIGANQSLCDSHAAHSSFGHTAGATCFSSRGRGGDRLTKEAESERDITERYSRGTACLPRDQYSRASTESSPNAKLPRWAEKEGLVPAVLPHVKEEKVLAFLGDVWHHGVPRVVPSDKGHMKAANERKRLLSKPAAILHTVVAIKLTPAELQGISRKLAERYS